MVIYACQHRKKNIVLLKTLHIERNSAIDCANIPGNCGAVRAAAAAAPVTTHRLQAQPRGRLTDASPLQL